MWGAKRVNLMRPSRAGKSRRRTRPRTRNRAPIALLTNGPPDAPRAGTVLGCRPAVRQPSDGQARYFFGIATTLASLISPRSMSALAAFSASDTVAQRPSTTRYMVVPASR